MGFLLLPSYVYLTLAFAVMFTTVRGQEWIEPSGEPKCYSRFDYDHKVLMKLVALETEQKRLHDVIEQQGGVIKSLQSNIDSKEAEAAVKLTSMSDKMEQLTTAVASDGIGTTYTRWGRTDCPSNGTELVYDGYAGGSHYTHNGGAANYLCLPKDPIWGVFQNGHQGGANVYGAEYELHGKEAYFGKTIAEHDVPCAVCRTKRSSVMLLPAKNQCHAGWTLEYSGYLSGGHYSQQSATEFVCLDGTPSVVSPGGESDMNGRLFYTAEANCGSLRCPPYVAGRELTCAVCSK